MERESRSATGLPLLEIINVLGADYASIFSVNRETQKMDVYRCRNQMIGVTGKVANGKPYADAMRAYIENNVAPQDKRKMMQETDFANVCERLSRVEQFTVHYRVKRNGTVLYFYMKCARVGDADSFENIILAFADEDADVRRNELADMLESGGMESKRKILVIEDNELNREILDTFLKDKFDVLFAENGEVGLELLAEHYRELSLVLLDICMPVCDGYEFLRRRKEDKLLSAVPVIVTTGSNKQDAELKCLDLGAVDFIPKPYNFRIVIRRINNVIRLRESAQNLTAVEHDELTGIYTKQAFFYHAKGLMRTNAEEDFQLVVADISGFKMINSGYGEKTGDNVLCYLANAYSKMVRNGIVCRYGGDRFACLVCGKYDLSEDILKKNIREITKNAPVSNLIVKYGIYENVDKSLAVSVICDKAFMAVKNVGDNYEDNIAYYTREMEQKQIRSRELENRFEDAISNKEFVAYFQPKYDVKTGKISGAESLVRWINPDGSMIMPGDFIPLYEGDGLIVRLDEYIFRYVCEFQKEMMEKGEELIPISVNLSRASVHHTGIVERYVKIVRENGIPFSCVPIELTETATLNNERIREFTEDLVNAGFALHMDDFGSGYSSLITLSELPFNTLKIDKSLIDYIDQKKGRMVVQQVIILAHGLGMRVVAEGVESAEQVELLREMDCDNIQGFYYSRPLPRKDFLRKFDEEK